MGVVKEQGVAFTYPNIYLSDMVFGLLNPLLSGYSRVYCIVLCDDRTAECVTSKKSDVALIV